MRRAMAGLWLRVRLWAKTGLGLILCAYLALFSLSNLNKPVRLWFWFGREPEVALLTALVVGAFVAAMAAAVAWLGWGVRRDLRALRSEMAPPTAGSDATRTIPPPDSVPPPPTGQKR